MKTPPSHVPAAHSMDTQWFAVDEEGHVGVFDTGEGGGLPGEALSDEQGERPVFEIEARRYARLSAVPGVDLTPVDDAPASRSCRIMVVSQAPVAEAELAALEPEVLRDAAPRVVMTRQPVAADVRARLAAMPGVKAVVDEYQVFGWLRENAEDHDDGVFHYSASDEYGAPGAYERARVKPVDPLHVSTLEASLQAEVGAVVLPVKFGAAEAIQLADHFTQDDVLTWGDEPLRGEGPPPEGAPPRPAVVNPAPPPARPASPGRLPLIWLVLGAAALLTLILLSLR